MYYKLLLYIVVCLPLLEVSIHDSAWETLSTDSDTLQYTITPELVDDQEVLHITFENTEM